MESPFYRSYWPQPARPRYSSSMREIPVQSIPQKPAGINPAMKVVQIPVHSVSSDPEQSVSASTTQKPEPDRSSSAIRIQKVFRGFLVKKSVKRIMSIRKEVEDIERELLCSETAELIRRDERERLRMNEKLMSLLFKLDSIRGVDSGVRECRKAVIRKAIFLQDKVDSIVSDSNQIAEENCEELQEVKGESDIPICECMEGSEEKGEVGNVIERLHNENETRSHKFDGEEENRRNRELLEKMVEKNEKMMRMMNELCHQNDIQSTMLNSLAQRVDQLEKAFICDRLKTRKKKKRHPA